MRIGIYNEPGGNGLGGCEYAVAGLAEFLSGSHQVEIVHHKTNLTSELLAEFSGTALDAVTLRHMSYVPHSVSPESSERELYRAARAWHADLSRPYDIFINFALNLPPFCHAPIGILVTLFPHVPHPHEPSRRQADAPTVEGLGQSRENYFKWEHEQRFDSYQVKTAISEYARLWARRRWNIDCETLYPPVDTSFRRRVKRRSIISVGRFTSSGHLKNQLEMVDAFHALKQKHGGEWEYFCVGALRESPDDYAYYEEVKRRAASDGVRVRANAARSELNELYENAAIFWHAAGLGVDVESSPELVEHFGVSTVEAMAAGCVPVVINKGGQSEIVQHGESGFVWNSMGELLDYTALLMCDDDLRAQMSEAARRRAEHFSQDAFARRLSTLLSPFTQRATAKSDVRRS